ncbi:MAG: glycosyltransferase family 4 protein [Helicobacteraceae bacterium]|nr:glycosyltransferase family 4 protein [Helicobacteraceae bacterium]
MKNIIIVNDYASVQGGAAQVAVSSARGLAEAGQQVTYVFGAGNIDTSLHHPNINVIDFGQYDLLSNPSKLNAAKIGIWNSSVEKQMHAVLDNFDKMETVIHLHTWVKALSASAVAAIVERGFPVVMTLHDYFSVCPNGGFYNYQTQSPCTLRPMSMACLASNCDTRSYPQKLWRVLRQRFYAKAGIPKQIKHFITVSRFSENILRPYLPEDAHCWDIPNPIDISASQPARPDTSETFSFIGRLSAEKGVTLFAEASKKTDTAARFVGSGDLDHLLKEINPKATFTGWADRDNVTAYIKDSRAVVFPSQWYETQGLVVAEAAALGVPSIVSDASAASDYIVDGETGLLFESGNIESLMQKLKMLMDDPTLAKTMGERAYENYWRTPYDINTHVKGLLKCYQTVLKDKQKVEQ